MRIEWRDALAAARRLAWAEGERDAARVIDAIPCPKLLSRSARNVRRLALMSAAVVARSMSHYWDLSQQIADLPGGPGFGCTLARWEAWQLVQAHYGGGPGGQNEPGAMRWRAGTPPIGRGKAVWLLLVSYIRPPRIQRGRPPAAVRSRAGSVWAELGRQTAAKRAMAPPRPHE